VSEAWKYNFFYNKNAYSALALKQTFRILPERSFNVIRGLVSFYGELTANKCYIPTFNNN
jgi:uncharacterized protein (UPF0297 family)